MSQEIAYDIEVKAITKAFGKRKVLDQVSFELKAGGFLSIFGPNGAGKTTLVKIMSTLVSPTEGQVFIQGMSVDQDAMKIRARIGLISHSPLLYPDLNAYENLQFYAGLYRIDNAKERIEELLESIELSHRRFDLIRTYSKGMLQRLSIARALLHKPSIIFLDEPYSGLDPHAVDILDQLINDIRHDHTFVMVTHDLGKGLEISTEAMIIENGKIVYKKAHENLDKEEFCLIYRDHVKGVA